MKKSVLFSLVSFVCIALISSCDTANSTISENSASNKVEKQMKTEVLAENKAEVKMEVEGMVCAMGCAKYIEDKVAGLEGIVASKVNFEEGVATFEYDKTALSPESIVEFIDEMHDGQYKAKVASIEIPESEIENTSNESEESIGSVSERIDNISLPQLFTFLLKRLR